MLLTPGLASTAIAAEGGYGKSAAAALDKAGRFMPWYPVFNLTGQPAISLPAGFGGDGLPLSVQLAGRIGDEETLYSLAGQIEAARPWAAERPAIGCSSERLRGAVALRANETYGVGATSRAAPPARAARLRAWSSSVTRPRAR